MSYLCDRKPVSGAGDNVLESRLVVSGDFLGEGRASPRMGIGGVTPIDGDTKVGTVKLLPT